MSERRNEKLRNYENRTQEEVFEIARKLGKTAMNCHHLIWMARDHKDFVRAEKIFQPQMYIPAHNELHANCPPVPRFTAPVLETVRANFEPTGDTISSLDQLLVLINDAKINATSKDEYLYALESQIPFLRNNIRPAKGYHR